MDRRLAGLRRNDLAGPPVGSPSDARAFVQSLGAVAWYRADLGVTTATGVSSWADQLGLAPALAQGTGGKQPTVTTPTGLASKSAVTADGADDQLAHGSNFTISSNLVSIAFPLLLTGAATGKIIIESNLGAVNGHFEILLVAGPSVQVNYVNVGTTAFVCTSTEVVGTYARFVVTIDPSQNGAQPMIWRNGVNSQTMVSTAGTAGTLLAAPWNILGRSVSAFLAGTIPEIIVTNRIAAAADIAAIDGYFVGRYG